MRKLASVQRVLEITPIDGADFIELAQINGWQCIVRKGEFNEGDLGVYFEIDSVPPNAPAFAFLWAPNLEPASNFRIRTKKLRGVLSQGLLMPLDTMPEIEDLGSVVHEDMDVTDLLKVKKYEVPAKASGLRTSGVVAYGPFPADVPKTDEERLQSKGRKLLEELRELPYVITEKCDGSSATFTIDRDVFRVCSRNWEIEPARQPGWWGKLFFATVRWFALAIVHRFSTRRAHNIRVWVHKRSHRRESFYWDIARKYNIETALRSRPDYALQGEIVGPGIQKNLMGLEEHELRAFDLYDKTAGAYLGQDILDRFCQNNAIPCVRTVERGDNFAHTQESLLKLAEGKYEGTKNEREGIVVRPAVPKRSKVLGGRLSFKVISNRYLLKETDE